MPGDICNWILDFLLNRQQIAKVGKNKSLPLVLITGTPQGCVLSPKLYSLFTYDCKVESPEFKMVKLAGDTTVTGLVTSDHKTDYRPQVECIVIWCEQNNLL
ncbi:hypothetical protein ElyMa_003633000 [Elysia marginata]|uniref:Reverse transcriptase domain-containing protein n=1 Tax=Elysia marginata TaxID=1093978 RepID=A0AAV4EUS4_9GAST|nr:hypothetical protein ElyMa_003633000 [Elysia marginata]